MYKTAISYLTQNKIFQHTFKLPSASVSSKGEITKQPIQDLRSVVDADLNENVKSNLYLIVLIFR